MPRASDNRRAHRSGHGRSLRGLKTVRLLSTQNLITTASNTTKPRSACRDCAYMLAMSLATAYFRCCTIFMMPSGASRLRLFGGVYYWRPRAVDEGRFHSQRRRAILREQPEVKLLFGSDQQIAVFAACVVAGQFIIAAVVADQPWWVILLAAYGIGAFASHYLNVVMHECSHNLVMPGISLNKAFSIVANMPALVPGAMTFRHYHLLHHRYLGRRGLDADIPMPWEVRLFGRSRFGKFLWLLLQPITYTVLHPLQVRRLVPLDAWLVANIVVVGGTGVAIGLWFGAGAALYLALSTYFALGPHPTGVHVLQEHLIFDSKSNSETSSYYGPINAISINHGLHLEHHDFPYVPGSRLPQLRRLAPSYYLGRSHHTSRIVTMWRFVMDRQIALDNRVILPETPQQANP